MGTRHLLRAGAAALALSAMAVSAQAGGSPKPLTAAQQGLVDLSELNLIVTGNMDGGHDVEGKTFVGGALTNGATFGLGADNNPGQGFVQSTFPTLTVGGNASGNLDINQGSYGTPSALISPSGAVIGGNATGGSVNLNGASPILTVGGNLDLTNGANGAQIKVGGSIGGNTHPTGASVSSNLNANNSGFQSSLQSTIAAQNKTFISDLSSLSKALEALNGGKSTTGDSVTVPTGNGIGNANHLVVTANKGTGYIVIDTTASVLEKATDSLDFVLKSSPIPVIINVADNVKGTITVAPNLGDEAAGPYVLWNFENATSIDLPHGFSGSILAPDATLTTGNQVNGSVAVATFNQGGEVHLGTFQGDSALSHVLGVPEPGAWAVMILGVGLVGSALRRRRAMVAARSA
jgi:choice-of-anchor A domain-containing protein